MITRRRLSVLTYPESRVWNTARCMEHDVMATGRTEELAVDALVKMLQAHIDFDTRHKRLPLSAFAPAPRLYREAFAESSRTWTFDGPTWSAGTPIRIDVAVVPQKPVVRTFAQLSRTA